MLTTTAAMADLAPTEGSKIESNSNNSGGRPRGWGGGRHDIDGRVIKVAESNLMRNVANGSAGRGGGAGTAIGGGQSRDHAKQGSAVQRLGNIIKCINCRR